MRRPIILLAACTLSGLLLSPLVPRMPAAQDAAQDAAPAQEPAHDAVAAPAPAPAQDAVQPPVQPAADQPPAQPPFAEWLDGVRTEALGRGVRPEIVDQAFAGLGEPLPLPLERDKTQAELTQSLESYISHHVNLATILRGRAVMQQNHALLDRISRAYGVPASLLVAIQGLESNYGRFSGVQPTIPVLATLAWNPRRAELFRHELFSALEILNRGDIEIDQMRGSWAGAMGQPQFMPSSYLEYAVDFDGDGRRDIWKSPADVFASIANYLKMHGWKEGERWGREVALSPGKTIADIPVREGGCHAMREMAGPLPLAEWRERGVKFVSGAVLPKTDVTASLTSGTRRHFLLYENYDALLSYNCAQAYALSVALLSDRLGP